MEQKVTLYHRKAKGAVKIWSCWIRGCWIYSEWGQQGGRMNRTKEVIAHGRRSLSAQEVAQEVFDRKVKKRRKRGYVDSLTDVVRDIRVDDDELNFDRLPKSFAPAKPIKSIELDTARELDVTDKLFIQRKRDGMRHYLVSDTQGRLRIYSSGKDDMTEHLMPLIKDLRLPPRTILDVELVATRHATQADEFLIVSGIARSLPERARRMIHEAEKNDIRIQLMAFDLLWWDGEAVYRRKYQHRYRQVQDAVDYAMSALEDATLEGYPPIMRMPLVSKSPTRLCTIDEARAMVKKFKWEGLVLWRKDQATVVQVNGTPKRVNCWKDKPVTEEDVIATGYELGKGKYRNAVGKFNVACRVGTTLVAMGNCGTGLDDQTRADALGWTYPCVIQIEYDQKSDKGFRFPVFIRKRDDKKPTEC